jgi:hypothetical protein
MQNPPGETPAERPDGQRWRLGRLIKAVLFLVLMAALAVTGHAIFFDLPAPVRDITIDLTLPNG